MRVRYILMTIITLILIGSVATGVIQAMEPVTSAPVTVAALENVRDYASMPVRDGLNYAVDGGALYAGKPGAWTAVDTPSGVIVAAVAVDTARPGSLYIGAANELAIYRSTDNGVNWLRVPLDGQATGGVTDIAVDSLQRLVFVGTDTAGLFRLRDVGSSMVLGGQLLLDEPVRQVATDSTGAALAFARTDLALYRAENYGLSWATVDNLHSNPTAVVIANTDPATIYVGTTDRGVLTSRDGLTWELANAELGFVPGSRLHVDALAIDAAQPEVAYVATSYLYGTSEVHITPSRVAVQAAGAPAWSMLADNLKLNVTDLLPHSGYTGAVYALATTSRSPLALGSAPEFEPGLAVAPAAVPAVAQPVASTGLLAWIVAALAAMALVFAIVTDVRRRRTLPVAEGSRPAATEPGVVHVKS